MAHFLLCPSSRDWAEDGGLCPGGTHQSTREGGCQCLQPTRGSLEPGGGTEFVKHNCSLSGTKEGGARAPSAGPPGAG